MQARLGHATADEKLNTYSHLWTDTEDRSRTAVDVGLAPALTAQPIGGRLQPQVRGRRATGCSEPDLQASSFRLLVLRPPNCQYALAGGPRERRPAARRDRLDRPERDGPTRPAPARARPSARGRRSARPPGRRTARGHDVDAVRRCPEPFVVAELAVQVEHRNDAPGASCRTGWSCSGATNRLPTPLDKVARMGGRHPAQR